MLKHVFTAGLLLLGTVPLPASAHAAAVLEGSAPGVDPAIVEVSGGCGPYGHRTPYGACRPNFRHRLACPYGFRPGPYGRRCFPD